MMFSRILLFVLIVPLLCEGISVQLTMPSHVALKSSAIRVTCTFATDNRLSDMTLFQGSNEIKAYVSGFNNYKIDPNYRVILEVGSGTTMKQGSLTFIMSWISCADITSYVCRGSDLKYSAISNSRLLQVLPRIEGLSKISTSEIAVKEYAEFMCLGTINKNDPYYVVWYRIINNHFHEKEEILSGVSKTKVTAEDRCSRSISSTFNYMVKDLDKPSLIIRCRIGNGLVVDKTRTFSIQGKPQTVQLSMFSYTAFNTKKMRVVCKFTSPYLYSMTLFYGNDQITATNRILAGFEIPSNPRISLEVGSGTTVKKGTLTFVFSWITCSDFTWYMCRAFDLDSERKTLEAVPNVDIIKLSTPELAINHSTVFACKATIVKEKPFSVEWYQETIAPSNQLKEDKTIVIGEDQCSRNISSSLTYDVKKSHGAELILLCRITNKGNVFTKRRFHINGAGRDMEKSKLPHLVVAFIASLFYLF